MLSRIVLGDDGLAVAPYLVLSYAALFGSGSNLEARCLGSDLQRGLLDRGILRVCQVVRRDVLDSTVQPLLSSAMQ